MAETRAKVASALIDVHYRKSTAFRVIHVDGCYGGVTPRGTIHCALYSERNALPCRTSLEIKDGQPANESVIEAGISELHEKLAATRAWEAGATGAA